MKENPVQISAEYVVTHAKHVSIDRSKLIIFAKDFAVTKRNNWIRDSFDLSHLTEDELMILPVLFNAISFSYWGEPYWQVTYKGKTHERASWSMVASILRSKEEGFSLFNIDKLSYLTTEELAYILRGSHEIPLLEERRKILNKLGDVLNENYYGDFKNIILEARQDALVLVDTIINAFSPYFDDHYLYKGNKIYFNKRAQALVEGVHSILEGKGLGALHSIEKLSALADYILPNVLRNAGILHYSKELSDLIDNKKEIVPGSDYEIEMRASVVWSINYIQDFHKKTHGVTVLASTINDNLWLMGGEIATPIHRARTIAY